MNLKPLRLETKSQSSKGKRDRAAAVTLDHTGCVYLAQVASDADVMPGIVVELAVDRFHQGLERP